MTQQIAAVINWTHDDTLALTQSPRRGCNEREDNNNKHFNCDLRDISRLSYRSFSDQADKKDYNDFGVQCNRVASEEFH